MIPSLYERGYIVNYPEGDFSLQRTKLSFPDSVDSKYHTVKEGDSLLNIAQDYYNDQMLWYIIAEANPDIILNPFELTTNSTLLIPSLELLNLIYG